MSVNKAILLGRLGQDPEIRYTKGGTAVASFSLATDNTFKDKNGARQQTTEWHNVIAWAKLAEFSESYLKKGREVYVEGRLQTRNWTDKDNVKHYKTEIVSEKIQFVGPAPKNGDQQPGDAAQGDPNDHVADDIPM